MYIAFFVREMCHQLTPYHALYRDGCLQEAETASQVQVDYGSLQANEAVKQLQQLGAVVYPPGEKKEVDWGLLAGQSAGCPTFLPQASSLQNADFVSHCLLLFLQMMSFQILYFPHPSLSRWASCS